MALFKKEYIILTEEDFNNYYEEKGRLPAPMNYTGAKELNSKQLHTKYLDYCKKMERKEERIDSILNDEDSPYISNHMKNQRNAKLEARNLDSEAQVFFSQLTYEEGILVRNMMKQASELSIIDPAHIFSVGGSPYMADVVENILMLPRAVHSLIDIGLNPLTVKHEPLNSIQQDNFWIRFIGIDRWNHLMELKKN